MPKVSVIVPMYQVEQYLAKCLDSLVNQTLKDMEIILVNDGSLDHSASIAKEYQAKYPQIQYIEKENGGLSSARNYGIPHATGDYIAFLDSDDYVETNMYEIMYQKAVEEDFDMVECNFIWEYPNKQKIDIGIPYEGIKEGLEKARVVAWNKLYKREVLLQSHISFPEGLRYEDIAFFYQILPSLKKIGFVENAFVHYIQRGNSISNTQNEKTRDIFSILDNVLNFYREKGLWEQYEPELEYIYTRYLLCSSLKRMAKIGDKQTRKKLLQETWHTLNGTFPNWKHNGILQKKGKKNFYMKTVNHYTYPCYCMILHML